MNNHNMDPFTEIHNSGTDTATAVKNLEKLVNEHQYQSENQRSTPAKEEKSTPTPPPVRRKFKNTLKLFMPVFIFVAIWLVIIIINIIIAIPRSEKNFQVNLISKESYISDSSSDYVEVEFEIQNKSKYNLKEISVWVGLFDKETGTYIYGQTINLYKELLLSNESKYVSVKLREYKHISTEVYPLLYYADLDDITTNFEVDTVTLEDGTLILYPYNWFTGCSLYLRCLYVLLLGASIIIPGLWILEGKHKKCKKCKNYFAIKYSGKKYLYSIKCPKIKQRYIRDNQGKVIGSFDEIVDGISEAWEIYCTCKYCGNVTKETHFS